VCGGRVSTVRATRVPKVTGDTRDLRHMRDGSSRATLLSMNNTHIASRTRRTVREVVLAVALVAFVISPAAVVTFAQAPPRLDSGSTQKLPDLVASLRATPGVLGVDAGQMASRKQVIFASFENKQAVLNWFYSDVHQAYMRALTPGAGTGRKPLADIADNGGPILAIASLTMADQPQVPGVQMPISQIAIELYAPLPGGLAAGGRFAPATVKVPGLIEVSVAAPAPRE
jgi:hypothetical protein